MLGDREHVQIAKKKAVLMLQMTSSSANEKYSCRKRQLATCIGAIQQTWLPKHGQPQVKQRYCCRACCITPAEVPPTTCWVTASVSRQRRRQRR